MDDIFVSVESEDGQTTLIPAQILDAEEEVGLKTLSISATELANSVKPVLQSLQDRLLDMKPNELTIKTTVGVGIEGGKALGVVVTPKANLGIEVTMTWKRSEQR